MIRIAVGLAVLLLIPIAAQAQRSRPRNVRVIFVPGLRADDLSREELPWLRKIVSRGAFGWMNTRTARIPGQTRESVEAACLTLGAGSRATAGPYANLITHDSLARLVEANSRLDHPVDVGLLGDMVHRAGRTTQVFGALDMGTSSSAAKLIAMDRHGRIDMDQTASTLWSVAANEPCPDELESPSLSPYGLQTDLIRTAQYFGAADLSLTCFGDLARADQYAPLCTPTEAARHRSAALSRLGAFLFEPAAGSIDSPALFILLAPSPANSAPEGDRLAPILMWGDGVAPGLLTSGSTHIPGLVTNTDFLPTVAQYFGITPPKGLVGRHMVVVPLPRRTQFQQWLDSILGHTQTPATNGPTPETWAAIHDRWYAQSRKQSLFGGLPTVQAVLVVGSLLLAARPRARSLPPCLLVSLSALPLALLVLPPLSPSSTVGSGILLAGVLLATAGFAWLPPKAVAGLATVLLAAFILIAALDLLVGGGLMRQAWMSYSVMEGARYYGIGNEYVGAVFGAMMALSVVALRGERIRRWPAVAGAWLAVSVLIGLPQFGANAGGFLGAGIGCGLAALVWWKGRIRARDAVLIIVAVGLAMAAVLAVDLARGGAEQSHIARAISGGGSVVNIAARKAMMNGYLVFHSPWTLGLLAAAYGLWRLWRSADEVDRATRGTWVGLVAGAIGLFVLNDSGVVAAAECLLVAYAGMRLLSAHPALGEST